MPFMPMGARIVVEDIVTTLSIEERAKAAGFIAIVNEDNRPRPTQGRVVAIGTDPFVQEHIRVGDVVSFKALAGDKIHIEDQEFRSLEFNEIIGIERKDV